MKVCDIIGNIEARIVCGDGEKEFGGVYVGDLLSRAMSRIECDDLWVTIMSNVNVIAVATLTEPAAIILAEDVTLDDNEIAKANENFITVLTTKLSAYEVCSRISKLNSEQKI